MALQGTDRFRRTKCLKMSLSLDELSDVRLRGTFVNWLVGDMILSAHAQDAPLEPHVKGLKMSEVQFCDSPDSGSI